MYSFSILLSHMCILPLLIYPSLLISLFCFSCLSLFLYLFTRCIGKSFKCFVFFNYACLRAASFSFNLWFVWSVFIFEPCLCYLMLAYLLSLPCHTPTTHFLVLSINCSSINQCGFTICPLHPLLCILLCALSGLLTSPGKKKKKHVYRQWSFRCNVFITRWEQALYGAG